MRSTISVALCTYNGEKYLPAQLASLATQSRLPDEVVVCDDRSRDGTPELIRDFSRSAPFPVRWSVNPENLGSTRNFAQAIERCEGELIAFADQDDVWLPQKLDRLASSLEENRDAGFAFSNADLVDDTLTPLGYTLWDALRFSTGEQCAFSNGRGFETLLRRNVVTGATLVIRACYKEWLLPIPNVWIHDGWIALLISAIAPAVFIDEPLIQYRQHARQQLGDKKKTLPEMFRIASGMQSDYFRRVRDSFTAAAERLETARGPLLDASWKVRLNEKVAHWDSRLRMREKRLQRLGLVLREAYHQRYGQYSRGWKSVLQDLFL